MRASRPYIAQRFASQEDSNSHTISQESEEEKDPKMFLKKGEERAYIEAITDSQYEEIRQEKMEIERREGVYIDPEMLRD